MFGFFAFCHVIWGLEDIQEDLFYLKYLQHSVVEPAPT